MHGEPPSVQAVASSYTREEDGYGDEECTCQSASYGVCEQDIVVDGLVLGMGGGPVAGMSGRPVGPEGVVHVLPR